MSDSTIQWSENDGIVTLTLDDPTQSVNTMNARYTTSMAHCLARLNAMGPTLSGVILTSGKKTFFAGGDLHDLVKVSPDDAHSLTEFTTETKNQLRSLETLGVPVVAAINGSALGGGLELALAAHHRIVLDAPHVRIGLPEVTLGLLPGGGGVVRTVRLLGLDTALDEVLLPGKTFRPSAAYALGLVDEIASSRDDLIDRSHAWIAANPDARQPWDCGAGVPGGTAYEPAVEGTLAARTAGLRARNHGAPMPAPAAILCAAVEGTQVDVDTAFTIETRYFVSLATGFIAKNIIQGSFFDAHTVRSGANRPDQVPAHLAHEVAVVGAGMMGAGIALTVASAGLTVHLKDVDLARAEHGKLYAEKALNKAVKSGRLTSAGATEILARIQPTAGLAGLSNVDLVIEAVFEDPALKAGVLSEVHTAVSSDALIASNTSTLPIAGLATAVDRPEDFIGLHFFSPVDRMDLVEIVVGAETSEKSVARAFDFVRQLGKTPIVVSDGRGFFTSRVILRRLLEAAAMVGEGISPTSIERAALRAGYPVGTLTLLDETTLTLPHTIYGLFRDDARAHGTEFAEHPGDAVLATLIGAGRSGRAAGAGFYDYTDGRRTGLWPGLETHFGPAAVVDDVQELVDRLLFAEALETARCLEERILRSTADANVGSRLGIGFPAWTGGAAQFIAGYPGGVGAFSERSRQLADRYGSRFTPPSSLSTRLEARTDA
ncbi:3-hydroxyacyl-CoA dehydrogenase [Rhodococcus sp. RS1C4]|nr:3-hydroxyacyl-CoA dehydrogenase NAD-binding domain-containing protein [Rhodococcus sp. RS1C4]OZC42683.1 3-hydroxyacyl-CoA dehydrogenase [Rhodococcus sp. RS1C4]